MIGPKGFVNVDLADHTEKKTPVRMKFAARISTAAASTEDFVAWGGVQATLEEEAKNRAEALVSGAAGSLFEETGIRPSITVKQGKGPKVVRAMMDEVDGLAALVLGAAATGAPGPLVSHFAATEAGSLPCPVMVVPGSLSKEEIDRLS